MFNRTDLNISSPTNGTTIDVYRMPENLDQNINRNIGAIQDFYIWIFLGIFVLFGIIINILTILILFRSKCNGTRYFLIQISFCDIGILSISGLELFYMNYRKWLTSIELCPIYLGIESFTSTAIIYFIVAINLHATSTYNLAIKTLKRRDNFENDYTELSTTEPTTDDDNYEIAINLHKRSVTIDYSKRKNSISVIAPTLFIWFLAGSISIPFFVFGNVLPNEVSPMICGVINYDQHNNNLMQIFVLLIRIIIPTICLHLTTICVIGKIFIGRNKLQPCGLDENVNKILQLALILSITYLFLSIQRIYGSLLFEVISKPFMHYKYPFMAQNLGILLSMINFLLSIFRPILYYLMDKKFTNNLISKQQIAETIVENS